MIECPHCESKKLEYYPDVDRASWVRHIYVQEEGKWKIKIFNDDKKDAAIITTGTIYDEDMMPFFYCQNCTAEIDGRNL